MIPTEPVIRDAKVACGKQIFAVFVVLKGTRFPDQRIDHVAIIDRMLAAAQQSRHLLDFYVTMPYGDSIRIDQDLHLVTDQATVNRIGVPLDLDRAATANRDVAYSHPMIQFVRRKLAELSLFLLKLSRPPAISFIH